MNRMHRRFSLSVVALFFALSLFVLSPAESQASKPRPGQPIAPVGTAAYSVSGNYYYSLYSASGAYFMR